MASWYLDDMKHAAHPILLTGSHRSGSTWAGRMIAAAPSVAYIQEPFNIHHRPGFCSARFHRWFTLVNEHNAREYHRALQDCLEFRYRPRAELAVAHSPKDIGRLVRDLGRTTSSRLRSRRPLVKDPIALFSAEWLAATFHMDVIVMVRHPAAFAGSLKVAHWDFPFDHFLDQPLLMKELRGHEAAIRDAARGQLSIVEQAILLWNLIHQRIVDYRDRHPEWLFVRHEDLSRDPLDGFIGIFQFLQLEFTPAVRQRIDEFSHGGNPAEQERLGALRRDSRANIWNWTNRLTDQEIKAVREGTQEVASRFYGDQDWRFTRA